MVARRGFSVDSDRRNNRERALCVSQVEMYDDAISVVDRFGFAFATSKGKSKAMETTRKINASIQAF